MHRERVEGFAAVGEVGHNRADTRRIERLQVKVQDLVTALDKIGNNRSPNHAAPAGKRDALAHECLEPLQPWSRSALYRRYSKTPKPGTACLRTFSMLSSSPNPGLSVIAMCPSLTIEPEPSGAYT